MRIFLLIIGNNMETSFIMEADFFFNILNVISKKIRLVTRKMAQ